MQQIKDGGGEQANRRKKLKTTNGGGELSRPAVGDERRVIYNGQETLMVCNFLFLVTSILHQVQVYIHLPFLGGKHAEIYTLPV